MSSPPIPTRRALANELFLIGHHEYTGKCHAGDEVFGLGLAAAVLFELGRARAIGMDEGAVNRTASTFTGDPVLDHVLGKIAGREPKVHQAAAWIDYLREDLYPLIGERLTRLAVLTAVPTGIFGRQIRYEAVDPVIAALPRSLMLGILRNPPRRDQPPADIHYAVLAGLVAAMEMWEAIPTISPVEATPNAAALISRMYPPEKLIIKSVVETKNALARRIRR